MPILLCTTVGIGRTQASRRPCDEVLKGLGRGIVGTSVFWGEIMNSKLQIDRPMALDGYNHGK